MDRHLLIKVADMLHEINPPIVNGKRRLRKTMRKFGLVNPPDESWLRNLSEGFNHCNIPHAMVGKPIPMLIAAFFPLV